MKDPIPFLIQILIVIKLWFQGKNITSILPCLAYIYLPLTMFLYTSCNQFFSQKFLDLEIYEEPVPREKLLELGRKVIDGSIVPGMITVYWKF